MVDLARVSQLIAQLQAIDIALANCTTACGRNPAAKIVVNYVSEQNIGHDVIVYLDIETARDILGIQRAAKRIALKLHGLDVE